MKRALPGMLLGALLVAACSPSPGAGRGCGGEPVFVAFEVFIDSGERPLGAWQFEWQTGEGVRVVGVEGGEGAFAKPPYHDPASLQTGRVRIAAFATSDLPRGRCRVAMMHMAVDAGTTAAPAATLEACADAAGLSIPGTITWQQKEMR